MNVRLIKHCKTDEDKRKYKEYILQHRELFDRIVVLLQEDLDSSLRDMYKEEDISRLVGYVSYQKAQRKLIELLTV